MYIIGENIHIISDNVKVALADRDARFFQELAVAQVEAGAQALDLNLGPRKKDWEEVFPWMVKTVEAVADVPLSLDSTNLAGIEAGLKAITKAQPIINSVSAEEERLEAVPLVAKKYNAKLVALTMGKSGIPVSADERVTIAIEQLIPRLLEIDYPVSDLIIDPLVLTVSGCQEYCPRADRSGPHPAGRVGSAPGHLGGSVERFQRGAHQEPLADQPRVPRHADGRRTANDDRRPLRREAE